MNYVKFNDKKYEATIQTRREDPSWNNRESRAITLKMTYAEAIETFVDNLHWSVIYENVNNVAGTIETQEVNMSEYAIAGAITDNRNGTITVRMGKYKPMELMSIPLAEEVYVLDRAVELREVIEEAMQSITDDSVSLKVKSLYPAWDELVGKAFVAENAGFKFRHRNDLYKTIQPNLSFVKEWEPGVGTESLFVRIDEVHAGTLEDPILYNGNMVLENGKYYMQEDTVYHCVRDTINAVYHNLSDLVGIYVEQV